MITPESAHDEAVGVNSPTNLDAAPTPRGGGGRGDGGGGGDGGGRSFLFPSDDDGNERKHERTPESPQRERSDSYGSASVDGETRVVARAQPLATVGRETTPAQPVTPAHTGADVASSEAAGLMLSPRFYRAHAQIVMRAREDVGMRPLSKFDIARMQDDEAGVASIVVSSVTADTINHVTRCLSDHPSLGALLPPAKDDTSGRVGALMPPQAATAEEVEEHGEVGSVSDLVHEFLDLTEPYLQYASTADTSLLDTELLNEGMERVGLEDTQAMFESRVSPEWLVALSPEVRAAKLARAEQLLARIARAAMACETNSTQKNSSASELRQLGETVRSRANSTAGGAKLGGGSGSGSGNQSAATLVTSTPGTARAILSADFASRLAAVTRANALLELRSYATPDDVYAVVWAVVRPAV